MKLLTEITDVDELSSLRMLLESNGIACHIGNEDSARNFGFIYPARKYAVFILYEDQYEDAVLLMKDEEHEVEHAIDIDEHARVMEEQRSRVLTKIFKATMVSFVVVVLLLFCFAWLMETINA